MSEEMLKTRREKTLPSYEESSSSRRDQAIVKAEEFLSDDFNLLARLKDYPNNTAKAEENIELIDPYQAIEPPAEPPVPSTASEHLVPNEAKLVDGKRELPIASWLIQFFIVCFVMVWVFILGIMVGRGNLWQTALGGNIVSWLEYKAGWNEPYLEPPKVVVEIKNLADEPLIEQSKTIPDDEALNFVEPYSELTANDLPVAYKSQYGESDGKENPGSLLSAATQNANGSVAQAPFAPGRDSVEKISGQISDSEKSQVAISAQVAAIQTALHAETGGGTAANPSEYGAYAVQVSLAANEDEAKIKQRRLESLGFKSYYYNNSRDRFPVRVGRFKNKEEAKKAQNALIEKGYRNTYISKLTP